MAGRRGILIVGLLLGAACAQSFDAASLGVPATLASLPGEAPQGERFRVNGTSIYFAWGLVSVTQPSLQRALAGQLVGGRAVAEVKIKVRSRWSDLLITGLTLGLVVPRTVTFEGVVTGGTPQ